MSLVDALLLDPYKINIWIARRADGLLGSGTQSDPYDGSVIGGTVYRFDQVMTTLLPSGPVQVNLGPGTFETKGYNATDNVGWTVRADMTIVGSGMDVTTLRLNGVSGTDKRFYVVGHPLGTLANSCELFDLTLDCNQPTNDTGTPMVACGAVRLMGNRTRTQRVKAINWGTNSVNVPCYVFAMILADPASGVMETADTVLEGCIAVNPQTIGGQGEGVTATKVKVLHAGSPETNPIPSWEGAGSGAVIRDCYVDCAVVEVSLADMLTEFQGISMGWCKGGVVDGNQVHNTKYGGPYQDVSGTPDIEVRNNFYKNVYKGPYWKLGSLSATIGAGTLGVTGGVATVSLSVSHYLAMGDRVKLAADAEGYSGLWEVSKVTSATAFQFLTSLSAPADADVTAVHKVMGVTRMIVEQNTIELIPATGTADDTVMGIQVDNSSLVGADPVIPAYVHVQALIRDNHIGYVDGLFDPTASYKARAIYLKGIRNAIVRENVVDLDAQTTTPIRHTQCESVLYFDNKTPAGAFVPGFKEGASVGFDGLEDLQARADDAFVLAFMGHS